MTARKSINNTNKASEHRDCEIIHLAISSFNYMDGHSSLTLRAMLALQQNWLRTHAPL
jgi:hypothetical protein